jgi:hypothetical protein
MARPRGDIDRGEMVELYRKGLSIRQLMAKYDCSYGLVNRVVSARTKLRPRGGPNNVKRVALQN